MRKWAYNLQQPSYPALVSSDILHTQNPAPVVKGQKYQHRLNLPPPEPIVIEQFHPKEGDWEGIEQLLNQLATRSNSLQLIPCLAHAGVSK